jgi:NAD(P)-dependent dehydrogenase (short-subunit alcohol dehydrogenase family)
MTLSMERAAGAEGLSPDFLQDSVHIVTGGTQGLGLEIARTLASCGARGVTVCGRNEDNGARAVEEIQELGALALFVQADLTEPDDCRKVVQQADARFGRVDGLTNAAASTERGTLDDTSVELWDRMFALNVRAPFLLTQECARVMRRVGDGGSVVNILSVSAHGGQPFIMAYSASKGALGTLTKNNAYALREDRIRVNAINMGWCATANEHVVQLSEGKPDNWLEQADASRPFGRILRPADVARLVAFLLGPGGQMTTGSLIDYDQIVFGAFD